MKSNKVRQKTCLGVEVEYVPDTVLCELLARHPDLPGQNDWQRKRSLIGILYNDHNMTDAQAGGILQLFLYTNNVDAAIICAWKPEVKAQYVARQAKAQEEAKRKRARLEEPAEPVELVA